MQQHAIPAVTSGRQLGAAYQDIGWTDRRVNPLGVSLGLLAGRTEGSVEVQYAWPHEVYASAAAIRTLQSWL